MIEAPHDNAGEAIEGFHGLRRRECIPAHQPLALALPLVNQNALDAGSEALVKLIDRRPDRGRHCAVCDHAAALRARLDPQA
ncbi:hypothetical protein [Bradyrhizobium sp. CCBAU 11434]|uniref:hypothetical protein n=1 Tax=Bradyrhizobium sp. CCBAU 11434 TaxID=1630885 RepID=UPI0023059EAE|nr:hypothetical protein [Bradyrhizobium sp. CCBAU 11434]